MTRVCLCVNCILQWASGGDDCLYTANFMSYGNINEMTLKQPDVIDIEGIYRVEKMWVGDVLSKEAHE